ncbi:ABC transporter permease [Streptomyces sp. RG38]|uniref:ABC transporter permease n=2 Tax=Streptomyces tagetis TaxID=2820809 RepID=A0A940XHE3_9ACTN|nr:ABC transporter permease [Streptomyces sp. RG38]
MLGLLVLLAAGSYVLPLVADLDYARQSSAVLQGPSASHWFGTDEFGRDNAVRVLVGARSSLQVAFGAALFAMVAGVVIGLVAGYFRGPADAVAMRVLDVLLALPEVVLALVIIAVLGNSGLNLVIAIGVAFVPVFARVTRAGVLALREQDFVVASRAMGARSPDTMARTVLPNVLGPIVVQFVITAAVAVVVSAALGFLGLGPEPPTPSWGAMMQTAKSYLYQNPWYGVAPGIALIVTVLCLDRLGARVRIALGVEHSGAGRGGRR